VYCLELKSRAHNLKQSESGGSMCNWHARLHKGGECYAKQEIGLKQALSSIRSACVKLYTVHCTQDSD
jgi:hypothetical protein